MYDTTEDNLTQYNTTQYNTIQHNTTQHNTTQYNTIQHQINNTITVYHLAKATNTYYSKKQVVFVNRPI